MDVGPHGLRLGDALEFTVGTDTRTGKLVAFDISPLPPGSLVMETVVEGRVAGVVEKEITRSSRGQGVWGRGDIYAL